MQSETNSKSKPPTRTNFQDDNLTQTDKNLRMSLRQKNRVSSLSKLPLYSPKSNQLFQLSNQRALQTSQMETSKEQGNKLQKAIYGQNSAVNINQGSDIYYIQKPQIPKSFLSPTVSKKIQERKDSFESRGSIKESLMKFFNIGASKIPTQNSNISKENTEEMNNQQKTPLQNDPTLHRKIIGSQPVKQKNPYYSVTHDQDIEMNMSCEIEIPKISDPPKKVHQIIQSNNYLLQAQSNQMQQLKATKDYVPTNRNFMHNTIQFQDKNQLSIPNQAKPKEITTISAMNPLNPNQQRTVFKQKVHPQISNQKQQKKVNEEDDIIISSDEDNKGFNMNDIRESFVNKIQSYSNTKSRSSKTGSYLRSEMIQSARIEPMKATDFQKATGHQFGLKKASVISARSIQSCGRSPQSNMEYKSIKLQKRGSNEDDGALDPPASMKSSSENENELRSINLQQSRDLQINQQQSYMSSPVMPKSQLEPQVLKMTIDTDIEQIEDKHAKNLQEEYMKLQEQLAKLRQNAESMPTTKLNESITEQPSYTDIKQSNQSEESESKHQVQIQQFDEKYRIQEEQESLTQNRENEEVIEVALQQLSPTQEASFEHGIKENDLIELCQQSQTQQYVNPRFTDRITTNDEAQTQQSKRKERRDKTQRNQESKRKSNFQQSDSIKQEINQLVEKFGQPQQMNTINNNDIKEYQINNETQYYNQINNKQQQSQHRQQQKYEHQNQVKQQQKQYNSKKDDWKIINIDKAVARRSVSNNRNDLFYQKKQLQPMNKEHHISASYQVNKRDIISKSQMRDKINRSHMGINQGQQQDKRKSSKHKMQRSQFQADINKEHYSSIMNLRKSFLSDRRNRDKDKSSDSNKINYSASEESGGSQGSQKEEEQSQSNSNDVQQSPYIKQIRQKNNYQKSQNGDSPEIRQGIAAARSQKKRGILKVPSTREIIPMEQQQYNVLYQPSEQINQSATDINNNSPNQNEDHMLQEYQNKIMDLQHQMIELQKQNLQKNPNLQNQYNAVNSQQISYMNHSNPPPFNNSYMNTQNFQHQQMQLHPNMSSIGAPSINQSMLGMTQPFSLSLDITQQHHNMGQMPPQFNQNFSQMNYNNQFNKSHNSFAQIQQQQQLFNERLTMQNAYEKQLQELNNQILEHQNHIVKLQQDNQNNNRVTNEINMLDLIQPIETEGNKDDEKETRRVTDHLTNSNQPFHTQETLTDFHQILQETRGQQTQQATQRLNGELHIQQENEVKESMQTISANSNELENGTNGVQWASSQPRKQWSKRDEYGSDQNEEQKLINKMKMAPPKNAFPSMIDCEISNNLALGIKNRDSDFSTKEEQLNDNQKINNNMYHNFQTFNSSNPIITSSETTLQVKNNDIPELDEAEDDKDKQLLVIGFDNIPVGRRPKMSRRGTKESDAGSRNENIQLQSKIGVRKAIKKDAMLKPPEIPKKQIRELQNEQNKEIEQNLMPIMDKKSSKGVLLQDDLPNLQDVFMKRKGGIRGSPINMNSGRNQQNNAFMEKSHHRSQMENDINLFEPENTMLRLHKQTSYASEQEKKELFSQFHSKAPSSQIVPKKEKSKEELAQLRKNMMKKKFLSPEQQSQKSQYKQISLEDEIKTRRKSQESKFGNQSSPRSVIKRSPRKTIQEKKIDQVLGRLAMGQKVHVDEKQMKRLTSKNYQNLPEIRQKKEDAKKQEELAIKRQKQYQYQKELDLRLRQGILDKKKKEKERRESSKSQGKSIKPRKF